MEQQSFFQKARPVWPEGCDRELNITCAFSLTFAGCGLLRLTASSLYRVYCNGNFVGYGPARGPHGYYRVDQWQVGEPGQQNHLYIEVACYQVNTFYTLDQPPFVQAELEQEGAVTAYTAAEGDFTGKVVKERLQKTSRYSFQRAFTEIWELSPEYYADYCRPFGGAALVECGPKKHLARGVAVPDFTVVPAQPCKRGTVDYVIPEEFHSDRFISKVGTQLKGYPTEELVLNTSHWMQTLDLKVTGTPEPGPVELTKDTFALFALDSNHAGFPMLEVECAEETEIRLMFDEIILDDLQHMLPEGTDPDAKSVPLVQWPCPVKFPGNVEETVSYMRFVECCNVIVYRLKPGRYCLEGFEVSSMKYLQPVVTKGSCRILSAGLRQYEAATNENSEICTGDPELDLIYKAAVHVFRCNTVDTLADCPSRERGSWTSDSFWFARGAKILTGGCLAERTFFEDYLLGTFEGLPKGMIPGLYPSEPAVTDSSDFDENGKPYAMYLPTHAMYFVMHLKEHLERTGEYAFGERFRKMIYDLFDFYRPFYNEYGVLERVTGWTFVEWSEVAERMDDVNMCVNMLFYGGLRAAGEMYQDPALLKEAEELKQNLLTLFDRGDGLFFPDNAVRVDGKLVPTKLYSEVCQYYAFFLGFADLEKDRDFFELLRTEFGPNRTDAYPEVAPGRLIYSYILRTDLLYQTGFYDQMKAELKGFFLNMAKANGSLWEHNTPMASLSHGVGAFFVPYLYHCCKE